MLGRLCHVLREHAGTRQERCNASPQTPAHLAHRTRFSPVFFLAGTLLCRLSHFRGAGLSRGRRQRAVAVVASAYGAMVQGSLGNPGQMIAAIASGNIFP